LTGSSMEGDLLVDCCMEPSNRCRSNKR
jgi:hypothetical protein